MQGSFVSGVSFSTGQPFDVGRVSDFDVAISHPELYQKAEYLEIGKGGRTEPINMCSDTVKKLGIDNILQRLSRISGDRPVNAMFLSLQLKSKLKEEESEFQGNVAGDK